LTRSWGITSTIAVLVFAVFTVVISLVATSVFLAPVLIGLVGVGIQVWGSNILQEMTSVVVELRGDVAVFWALGETSQSFVR
jgi:hypothetical protein